MTDVAYGPSSDQVITCSDTGEVFLVDLSDYMPIVTALHKSPARTAVMSKVTGELLVGYDDGFVRAWSAKKKGEADMMWEMHCHRGGVTVLKESADFIVSGGNDFSVRFWHRGTRELLSTFTNHRKPVADIVIDMISKNIAHSGSEDKLMVTYDLKKNKALIQHSTQSSYITGLSQRKDRENEVVTTSMDGKILFWDVDYADPTGCFDSPSAGYQGSNVVKLRCLEVSPSGRYIAARAEDCKLYIYDLVSCGCIQECGGHSEGIAKVRWSPDQKQIVTAGKDGCVIVWNFFEL